MPIPAEKIIERARASGFDAELSVSAALRKFGWGATSNVYYIDDDEDVGRELDILGHKPFFDNSKKPELYCWLYICAEVKRTAEPFIFFSDESQSTDFGIGYGLLHTKHRIDRFVLSFDGIDQLCPISNKDRIARSYIAFKDSKSQQVRGGIISAFKGALYQAAKDPSRHSDVSHDISFYIPMVIVDGPLWEVYHSKDTGCLVANEVDEIIYLQHYLSPSYHSVTTRIAVVTLESLPSFLSKMDTWGLSIKDALINGRGKYAYGKS